MREEQLDLLALLATKPTTDARGRPFHYFTEDKQTLKPDEAVHVELYDCANTAPHQWEHVAESYCSACGSDLTANWPIWDRKPCPSCGKRVAHLWRIYLGGYEGHAAMTDECGWLHNERCNAKPYGLADHPCPVRTHTGTCPLTDLPLKQTPEPCNM